MSFIIYFKLYALYQLVTGSTCAEPHKLGTYCTVLQFTCPCLTQCIHSEYTRHLEVHDFFKNNLIESNKKMFMQKMSKQLLEYCMFSQKCIITKLCRYFKFAQHYKPILFKRSFLLLFLFSFFAKFLYVQYSNKNN